MSNADIRAEYEAMQLQYYTPREEVANAITHGIGTPIALAFMIYFLIVATTFAQVVTALFMCLAAMLVYTTSCVYHALTVKSYKRIARKFDHANIGLLVTACSVPYMLMLSTHFWNYVSLALCLAICALDAMLCFIDLMKFKKLGVVFNVVIGALGLSAFCVNADLIPSETTWIYASALASCVLGLLPYCLKRFRYAHTLFHILTLIGPVLFMTGTVFLF